MQTEPIKAENIRYNAASGMFEATVTLHSAGTSRTYACDIAGPLSMDLEQAETALRAQAIQRHTVAPGLYSAETAINPPALRALRTTFKGWRTLAWLRPSAESEIARAA